MSSSNARVAAAGRAGRRSSEWAEGLVTCLHESDVRGLRVALATPAEALAPAAAGLFPEFDQLEAFAGNQLGQSFPETLRRCEPPPVRLRHFATGCWMQRAAGCSLGGRDRA